MVIPVATPTANVAAKILIQKSLAALSASDPLRRYRRSARMMIKPRPMLIGTYRK